VVIALAVVLTAYDVLRRPSITVEDDSLTRFSLATTPAAALAYNLSLRLAMRNSNWAMTMTNMAPLEAAYSFDGEQFDRVQVSDKGRRYDATMTTVHDVVTRSDSVYVALGTAGVAEYGKQKTNGTFTVEANLTGNVKYTVRYTKCKMEATCPLELQVVGPLSATPELGVVFVFRRCHLNSPSQRSTANQPDVCFIYELSFDRLLISCKR
jgi:hypothetical protein